MVVASRCGLWAKKVPFFVLAAARARELAEAQKNTALVQSLEQRLSVFRAGLPFRDTPPVSPGEGK